MVFVFTSCQKDDDNNTNTGSDNSVTLDSDIITPTTLTADKTWIVDGAVEIISDVIIEPGTVIKFLSGSSLIIGWTDFGSLKAVGTPDKPIIFTSAASSPGKGDWVGIYFESHNASSVSELSYCTIEYCGSDYFGGLNLTETSIKMNHCAIEHIKNAGIMLISNSKFGQCSYNAISDCTSHPVETDIEGVPTIDSTNIMTAEPGYGIHITGTEITKKVTWQKHTVPYIRTNWLDISDEGNNAELTICAGANFRMGSDGAIDVGYYDKGKLIVNGTSAQPVTFTSNALSPSAGDWNGIFFEGNTVSGSKLDYCNISYGGGEDYYQSSIFVADCGSNVTISNCSISNSENYGVYVYYATPVLINVTYENNGLEDYYLVADK